MGCPVSKITSNDTMNTYEDMERFFNKDECYSLPHLIVMGHCYEFADRVDDVIMNEDHEEEPTFPWFNEKVVELEMQDKWTVNQEV